MRIVIGMFVGAVIGFAVGWFMKSHGGTCPLTCNPIIATVLGALIGAMFAAKP